ncbi:MAG: hypothetical protein ACTH7Q_05940 [Pseudoalteromonas sp.]
MLKRRHPTHKFKRNIIYSTATRRRIMLRNLHKKVIWRRRMYAMQQMNEINNIAPQQPELVSTPDKNKANSD